MPHTRGRKAKSKAAVSEEIPIRKPFDIPYFAHQKLNPVRFPKAIGAPVGAPPPVFPAPKTAQDHNDGSDWSDDKTGEISGDEKVDTVSISKRARSDSNNAVYKRMKVTGGRPAVQKKITVELDSDDELLVRMKTAKYQEKEIAKKLADEGRVNYNPKTIGSRWARIKRVMQQKQDELLDAELTDWHEGDDNVLYQAIEKAEEEYQKVLATIEMRKWRTVADEMKNLKPVTNFSHKACRNRYESLQAGNAKPTPESMENPNSTTVAKILSRKHKEQKILDDIELFGRRYSHGDENVKGNAWTSRTPKYY